MEFSAYQRAAGETSQLRLGGPQGAIAPMLGLASETGSILNVYKKYLRDGIDLAANREFLRGELGDLLWYTAGRHRVRTGPGGHRAGEPGPRQGPLSPSSSRGRRRRAAELRRGVPGP